MLPRGGVRSDKSSLEPQDEAGQDTDRGERNRPLELEFRIFAGDQHTTSWIPSGAAGFPGDFAQLAIHFFIFCPEESCYRDIYKDDLKTEVCTHGNSTWKSFAGVDGQFRHLGYFRAFVRNLSLLGFHEQFRSFSLPPVLYSDDNIEKYRTLHIGVFRDSTIHFSSFTDQ
ncbi:hypothetical protein NC653_023477 [Populus alba x Populus x berolinensis]|uniref:Uncharacterized protein n=1 Tax=Populus alba x Populus x berolinensis TaxID=444605 RepID=A0AAD6MHQ4_9ROSI|nr:hypothetical protein NC653_023477 [Populus alba x Populus x berolinensis]